MFRNAIVKFGVPAFAVMVAMVFGVTTKAHALVMVDFESQAAGSLITTEIPGLSFETFENGASTGGALVDGLGGTQLAGALSLYNCNAANCGVGFDPAVRADVLRITFDSLVSDLSFLHNGEGYPTTFNAYDAGGVLIDTQIGGSVANTVMFSVGGIKYIEGLQFQDNIAFVIDNISFATAVPEPTTGTMMIAGLALMAWRRRQRPAR